MTEQTDAAEATAEHIQWLHDNLPLDNLGHITTCSAFGEECGCATLARRLAAREAAARAEAWERGYRTGGSDRITSEVTPNPYRIARTDGAGS